jgi:serine/threonine protein kinase
MSVPSTATEFLDLLRKSGLVPGSTVDQCSGRFESPLPAHACADELVKSDVITPFQARSLLAGKFRGLVLGQYRILRPLGRGGMGVVYLAEHRELDRRVAIKVLVGQHASEAGVLERFLREARSAAALDHPNIVRLYDVCHTQGAHFLVMEYVDGNDLQALLETTGRLHYAQAAGYISQAAAGLRHAHGRGFVHRDIKPANLILAKNGTLKVLDMGLARSLVNPRDELTGQLDDTIIGTADFISPEQALAGPVDARSDIYSLGATLYALVTGQPPYSGNTTQKLTQHQLAPPPDARKARPEVPAELGAVIARMMAKNPADRYASTEDVIEALAPWAEATGTAPVLAELAGTCSRRLPKPKPRANRNRRFVIAGTVALACGAGLVLALLTGGKPAVARNDPPPVQQPPAQQPKAEPPVADTPKPPVGEPPVIPPPVAEKPPLYQLDLSSAKVFAQVNTGRTANIPDPPLPHADAPKGWFTHSWVPACTHEFFVQERGGQSALGIRLVEGPKVGRAEAMLFLRPVKVEPNAKLALRVEYMTAGGYVPADVRVAPATGEARKGLKVLGKLPNTGDRWETTTFKFVAPAADAVQIEFHHHGPLGEGNELMLRALELREDE